MDNEEFLNLVRKSSFFKLPGVKNSNEIRLNIGAGPNIFPFNGWINYDREDFSSYFTYISNPATDLAKMPEHQQNLAKYLRTNPKIDYRIHDLRNNFQQHADNSISSIYIGQVIEHLNPIYEVPALLKDCYRMLVPNGVIRMTTPDLDLLIKSYLENKMDQFSSEQPDYYKEADPSLQLAYIMYGANGPKCTWNNYEGHMCLYTQKSMTKLLMNAGFKDIEFYYETGKSKDPIMQKQVVDAGMSHSFIVEAVK